MIEVVDPDEPSRIVEYGHTGRVRLTTLTREFFMPRFLERDEAEREPPYPTYPWDGVRNVRFAWYHYNPRGETTAFGRIYVLDREFLGVPGDLSPSMPGFLARSEPEASGTSGGLSVQGSEYTLPESLVLAGSTRYWFYTDKQGAYAYSFDKDLYADGNLYVTGYFASPFRRSMASGRMVNGVYVPPPPGVTTDANFRLRGVAK
jgi:hypothetical protein